MPTSIISKLNNSFSIRKVDDDFVSELKTKIEKGYAAHFPILVDQHGFVIDGHHRLEACRQLGFNDIPVIIQEMTESERYTYAVSGNEASETSKPMTFVDYAELIWSMDGTQQQTADLLGWSVDMVKRYSALKKVTQTAWASVVTSVSSVTEEVTSVNFSEGILRPVIQLTESQQVDLVDGLISQKYSKQAFKKQAENYHQQNKDIKTLDSMLKCVVLESIYNDALNEVLSGKYDLNSVIQFALDKHNKETSIHLIHGNCIDELKKLASESIDLIATDPPYNMDKAEWDSFGSGEDFAKWCEQWLIESKRVLKPGGSIYIFGINRMLSHLQGWLDANMVYRNWIVWDTIQGAGGGLWVNRHESILYYSKTSDTYEDKDAIKLERHEENVREYKGKSYKFKNPSNVWRFPCVDNKHDDRTEHVTQKPVEIMERIIKASCPSGGLVCDPFSGSGTTAVAAYRNNRKFIGYELDNINFTNSLKRINDEISS